MSPAIVMILGIACAHAPPAPAAGPEPTRDEAEVRGLRVTTAYRPTPGWLHLSLWIDAGSRDGAPPQLATAAAWVAAARSGAEADVFPDGIALSRTCRSAELEGCVAALGRGLRARTITPDEVGTLRDRLARARSRAGDAGRIFALALEGLFGPQARSFVPLGRAEDDGEVTRTGVEAFLARHFGPRRARLVAAGDVERGALRAAVELRLTKLPPATAPRREAGLPEANGGVRVELGQEDRVAVAALAPTVDAAAAWLEAVERSWRGRWSGPERAGAGGRGEAPPPRLTTEAFGVRGGAIALVQQAKPGSAPHRLRDLAYAVGMAAQAELPSEPHGSGAAPPAVTQAVGYAWATADDPSGGSASGGGASRGRGGAGSATAAGPPPLGGAALLAEGKTATASVAARAFDNAMAEAERWLAPPVREHVGARVGRGVLRNGARVASVQQPSAYRMAVAVRFAGGAGQDPPGRHGQAALLATAMTTACAGLSPGALEERLRRMGARLAPIIDATSFGVVLDAPPRHWRAATQLATRCALSPSLRPSHLERARVRLQARLGTRARLAARAAAVLAPQAPGLVAPLGAPASLARVRPAHLSALLRAARSGARTSAALVGPPPAPDGLRFVASQLAPLPPGRLPARPAREPAPPKTLAADGGNASAHRAEVVLAFRAEGPRAAGTGRAARSFARAVGAALGTLPAIDVLAVTGGAAPFGPWAAVALRVPQAGLSTLPERIGPRLGGIEVPPAAQADRWAAGRPARVALSLTRREGQDGVPPGGTQPGGTQPGGSQPGGSQPGGSQPGGSQPGGSPDRRALGPAVATSLLRSPLRFVVELGSSP